MFGLSTPDSKPDTERGCYGEWEWYGEANGLLTEPVEQGSVEQPVQDRAAKSTPVAWEAQPVQYQPVALDVSVTWDWIGSKPGGGSDPLVHGCTLYSNMPQHMRNSLLSTSSHMVCSRVNTRR
ncbi:hypothetical protein DPMN_008302 [Dreissena polymorpha]|uniref:Uncharacterized protein n=1 Tax=Dreissena polymorpha TaxID=45954 RepID=A0A9D4RZ44_DREPO|nr:hypothetical protein DPMN_008302 [Dreissena polymorpha]